MKSTYRKGSMGAADAKEMKTALIVFTAIFFAINLLFVIPNPWFFHYYWQNAGWVWKIIAVGSSLYNYYFLWTKFKDIENPIGAMVTWQQIALFGWPLLNIFFYAGWEFPLPR